MDRDPYIYEFGEFRLDANEFLLLRGDTPLSLPKRAFEMLLVLVQRSPHLVEKSELISTVWKGAFVEEGNVAVIVSILRKTLGGDRNGRVYIETVSKVGYRFVAQVHKTQILVSNRLEVEAPHGREIAQKTTGRRSWKTVVTVATGMGLLALTSLAVVELAAPMRVVKTPESSQSESSSNAKFVPTREKIENPEARQNYLAGLYYGKRRTHRALNRSVDYYQKAVLKDPQDARAYSGLADAYSSLATFETQPIDEEYSLAKAAATRAVQLDASLAESHTSVGIVSFRFEWDWLDAETELRRAIQLNPTYLMANIIYANCLAAQGRLDESLEQARHAEQLDPLSASASTVVGRVYYFRRQYDQSISALQHAIDLDPYYERSHTRLGQVYAIVGDYPSALHEFQISTQLSEPDPYLEGFSGYVEARSGNTKAARDKLTDLVERSRRGYIPAFSMALISIGLGDHDLALHWLEQSYRDRSEILTFAMVDPLFDPVRSDPHFAALLKEMGLKAKPGRENVSPLTSNPTENIDSLSRQ